MPSDCYLAWLGTIIVEAACGPWPLGDTLRIRARLDCWGGRRKGAMSTPLLFARAGGRPPVKYKNKKRFSFGALRADTSQKIVFPFPKASRPPPRKRKPNERGKKHHGNSWPSMRLVGKISDQSGIEPISWARMAKRKGLRAEFPTSWD